MLPTSPLPIRFARISLRRLGHFSSRRFDLFTVAKTQHQLAMVRTICDASNLTFANPLRSHQLATVLTICDAFGNASIYSSVFFFFYLKFGVWDWLYLKFLLREELLKVICLWVLVSLLSFDSLLMFEFIFTYNNFFTNCGKIYFYYWDTAGNCWKWVFCEFGGLRDGY